MDRGSTLVDRGSTLVDGGGNVRDDELQSKTHLPSRILALKSWSISSVKMTLGGEGGSICEITVSHVKIRLLRLNLVLFFVSSPPISSPPGFEPPKSKNSISFKFPQNVCAI